mgnify:CR=1 FL=1
MNLKELYQEIILDHGKNPRNFGKCKNFTSDAKGHNPLCGDKVHIYAQLDNNKKILDLSFEGEGCAISLASASILTDILKGKEFSLARIIAIKSTIPIGTTELFQSEFKNVDIFFNPEFLAKIKISLNNSKTDIKLRILI